MSTRNESTPASASLSAEAPLYCSAEQAKIPADHKKIMEIYEDFKVAADRPAVYKLDEVISIAFKSVTFDSASAIPKLSERKLKIMINLFLRYEQLITDHEFYVMVGALL